MNFFWLISENEFTDSIFGSPRIDRSSGESDSENGQYQEEVPPETNGLLPQDKTKDGALASEAKHWVLTPAPSDNS